MKVLILANNDVGLYKFRKELLEALLKEHKVYICLPNGAYVKQMVQMGCEFVECNCLERRGKNPFSDLRLLSFYRETLKRINPNIVFTYTIKPNVYGGMACASLSIPYVTNITGLGSAVENGGILQKITLFLYKLGLKKAQKVFFQNTANRDFMLSKGIINGKYDLLPGSGVNLNQYKVLDYPDNDTVDFVFIARIMKEKGIEQYIDAAKYIRAKYPCTRFHICGFCDESYENVLAKLHEEKIIIYHGVVDNIAEIHKISSCTIHPTYYPEGLSNVLLESAACGRPVITTDRPGCREVVNDGVNGFVVREKNSQHLIEKIEMFLSLSREERKAMGLAGRLKVEEEFDRKIVVEMYLKEIFL